jgi:hypothetical protein
VGVGVGVKVVAKAVLDGSENPAVLNARTR